jgi:hypothetical protein
MRRARRRNRFGAHDPSEHPRLRSSAAHIAAPAPISDARTFPYLHNHRSNRAVTSGGQRWLNRKVVTSAAQPRQQPKCRRIPFSIEIQRILVVSERALAYHSATKNKVLNRTRGSPSCFSAALRSVWPPGSCVRFR